MVSYVVYDNEADFYDIYYASCLNGWTMGDLAVAPSDITRFYYYLFGSEVMGPGSESVCVPLRGRLLAPMLSFISSRPDTRAGCPTMVPPPPRCHRLSTLPRLLSSAGGQLNVGRADGRVASALTGMVARLTVRPRAYARPSDSGCSGQLVWELARLQVQRFHQPVRVADATSGSSRCGLRIRFPHHWVPAFTLGKLRCRDERG
jgi:hypothetical protein